MSLKRGYLAKPFSKFWLLNADSSPLFRPHSDSLPNRRYVYKPNNKIKGNKPIGIGYEFSCVSLSARQPHYGASEPPWNLPLSMRLIPFDENRNSFTAKQVNDLLNNEDLPFGKELSVNALDSNYASVEYIVPTHDQPNLVNIIRLASNRNVWKRLSEKEQADRRENNEDNRGATAIYGQVYKLSNVENWGLAPDQTQEFGIKLANGKQVIVRVALWQEMMIRSKRGKSMKDKPFRLAQVKLLDAKSGEPIFKRPMWLGIWGDRRAEFTPQEIFWAYRNRFDIEHFFRFGKQRLLLDHFQTPEEEHLQNWLEVVNSAYWLLWVASQEARHKAKKWQEYDPNFKKRKQLKLRPSPSEVQQQLESIILGFENEPFLPKLQIKGKGRKTGTKLNKRGSFPVCKKTKKKKKAPS